MIELDVPARRLHLDVADAELARAARGLGAAGAAAGRGLGPALPRPRRRGRHRGRPRLPQGLPRQGRGPGLALMAVPFPVALVGVGKIARDQHIPAIAADPDFELVAAVSRHATIDGVPNFHDIDRFLAEGPEAAVALCVPPAARTAMALKALAAGRDVLLEKPPAATLGEVDRMVAAAARERARCSSPPGTRASRRRWPRRRPGSPGGRSASVGDRLEGGRAALASGAGLDLAGRRLRRLRPGHQRAVDPDRDPARRRSSSTGALVVPGELRDADRRGLSR